MIIYDATLIKRIREEGSDVEYFAQFGISFCLAHGARIGDLDGGMTIICINTIEGKKLLHKYIEKI